MPIVIPVLVAILIASIPAAGSVAIANAASAKITSDGRTAPPEGNHAISATDAEPLSAADKAQNRIIEKYGRELERSLHESASARDRALALMVESVVDGPEHDRPTSSQIADHGKQMRAAAEAAPDDALLQWLWATGRWREYWATDDDKPPGDEQSGCSVANPCPHRLEALARLQPDNIAALMPAFNTAWRTKRIPAAESILAQMTKATRFDDEQLEALKAWLGVFQRYPFPKAFFDSDEKPDRDAVNILFAYTGSMTQGLLDYIPLIAACDRTRQHDAPVLQFQQCAQVGRVMLDRSVSLTGRMLGRELLRVSGQATAADVADARTLMWQDEQDEKLSSASDPKLSVDADLDLKTKTRYFDWAATNDAVKARELELQRAHISLTPPADWEPTDHGKIVSPLGEVDPLEDEEE